jgi:citrate synthase
MTVFQSMGEPTADAVAVRGLDLASELIGTVAFTELFLLELTGRLPGVAERAVLDAVLVALTEHGLTPTAVVARLTDLGAPGAVQGAVAAGLLGAGDRFLGALDGCARILQEWPSDADDTAYASAIVRTMKEDSRRVPGLGHPTHVNGDPRATALFRVADRVGLVPTMRRRTEALQAAAEEQSGRTLPINVDGACAALLSQIGLPWQICRGVALVARAAGLVGHLWDEAQHPTATAIWQAAEQTAPYRPPSVG